MWPVDHVLVLVVAPVDEENLPVVQDEVVAVLPLLLVVDDTDVDNTQEVEKLNVVRKELVVVLAVVVLVLVPVDDELPLAVELVVGVEVDELVLARVRWLSRRRRRWP